MDQDGTWHGGESWSSPHCARWRPSSPPQKGGRGPQFSVHFCCDQTAGFIEMPLGIEIASAQATLCSTGTQLPPEKRHNPPTQLLAHVYCGQTAGWIDATWYGSRPQPRPHCVRRGPAKGSYQPPPLFLAHVYHGHSCPTHLLLSSCTNGCQKVKTQTTRMWANAQRDGRPVEHRWRPLFNAAKFG